jgi:type IV pilus assembly protein PilM
MKGMIGIDIGATAVRAAEVVGVDSNGFAVVRRLAIAPIAEGAVVAGRVKNVEQVAAAMLRVLKESGLPRYGVVIGMATPDVALTRMLLPASVRREERIPALLAAGRPIAPTFGLDESALATSLAAVEPQSEGVPLATIDVAAARQAELDTVLAACRLAKITPRAVDLTGAALLRSLTRANPSYGEISTVVDIGATKTTVATREGLRLRSVRTIVGGGTDLTRALMVVTEDDFEAAEKRKMTMRLTTGAPSQISTTYFDTELGETRNAADTALSQAADLLVDAIGQAIEADAANHGSFTQGIALCGGSSLLRGLKDRLQSRVGVPVMIGRPWAEIEQNRKNATYIRDGRTDPRILLAIAPAVGLALWREPA